MQELTESAADLHDTRIARRNEFGHQRSGVFEARLGRGRSGGRWLTTLVFGEFAIVFVEGGLLRDVVRKGGAAIATQHNRVAMQQTRA